MSITEDIHNRHILEDSCHCKTCETASVRVYEELPEKHGPSFFTYGKNEEGKNASKVYYSIKCRYEGHYLAHGHLITSCPFYQADPEILEKELDE